MDRGIFCLKVEKDHCLRVDGAMEKEGVAENVGQLALAQVLQHEVV